VSESLPALTHRDQPGPKIWFQHQRDWIEATLTKLSFDGGFVETSQTVPPNHLVILKASDDQGEFVLHAQSVHSGWPMPAQGFAVKLYGDASKRSLRWAALVRARQQ